VVVDHMGRPDVTKSIDGPEFGLFLDLMRWHENVWTKVSCPERLSITGPPALDGERNAYRDVVPFARRLVGTFPDRVLWGTAWPPPTPKTTFLTMACWSTTCRISRPPSNCSTSCWLTTRCGCTGDRDRGSGIGDRGS